MALNRIPGTLSESDVNSDVVIFFAGLDIK